MMRLKFQWMFLLVFAALVFDKPVSAVLPKAVTEENEFIYNDHGKRDPFWTLLGRRGTIITYDKDIHATDMILEGVMIEPSGDSIAIINSNIVKVGDKVGLFIIKEIQVNTVILEKGQEIVTLKLKKEE